MKTILFKTIIIAFFVGTAVSCSDEDENRFRPGSTHEKPNPTEPEGGLDYSKLTADNHPRLLMNAEAFTALKAKVDANASANLTLLHNTIMGVCNSKGMNATALTYKLDASNKRILDVSRDALLRIFTCAYAYRMTGDAKYLTKAETDINAVSKALLQLNVGSIKNAVSSNVEVTLYDSNNYEIQSKYIVITPSEVEISVPVYKTVLYGIQPDLVIDKNRFDYAVSPSALYLKGTVNDVESVSVLKTQRAWIDAPGEYELTLALPENVTAYSSYTAEEGTAVTKVTLTVTEKPTQETQSDNTESANG